MVFRLIVWLSAVLRPFQGEVWTINPKHLRVFLERAKANKSVLYGVASLSILKYGTHEAKSASNEMRESVTILTRKM